MKNSPFIPIAFCLIILALSAVSFAASGSLDTTFYGTGVHRNGFGFGYDTAGEVMVQADGKIITVGEIENGEHGSILIVRYRTDGTLDPTFGEGGFVTDGYFSPTDAVLQNDGKLVLIGSFQANTNTPTDFIVTRYNPNGTRDMSFGNQGVVTTDFNGGYDRAWGVALQTDGKIVLAGWAYTGNSTGLAVARYNPDGSLDASFGNGGKKTTVVTGNQEGGYAVAIQPDGKIVVAGATIANLFCYAIVRYLPNGDLDTSFDGDGIVVLTISNSVTEPNSILIQPDGKILVGGNNFSIILLRFNPDGALDTTFGGTGIVRTTIRKAESCNELKLQRDGKILVAGGSWLMSNVINFAVLRYNTNGTLDSTFGTGGMVLTQFDNNHEIAYSIAIQPDDKIIAAGTDDQRQYDTILARYNPDGTLDPAFNGNGTVSNDFGSDNSEGRAVAIQPDGKIVIAGVANDFPRVYIAVARYNVNGTLDTTFGGTGRIVTRTPETFANPRAITVQPDGKIIVVGSSYTAASASQDFIALRYNPDGSLDTAFDVDGIATTDMAVDAAGSVDTARTVDVQADGKILLAGNSFNNTTNEEDISLVRYNADGSLDATFNGTGKVRLRLPDYQYLNALKVQPDGKIAAVGNFGVFTAYPGGTLVNYNFAALRFNGNGTLDTTFDADGIAVVSFGDFPDVAYDIVLQPNGKIVAIGSTDRTLNRPTPALARFNVDGSLDSTFGENGKVVTILAPNGGGIYAARLQGDGKIIVGGIAYDQLFRQDSILARYNANGSLDDNFGINGIAKTNLQETGSEVIRDLTLDGFGRIVVTGITGVSSFVARFDGDVASLARLSGRVTNVGGQGIFGVTVKLSGPALTAPVLARTNNFGYYNFPDTPIGSGYVVTVNSKRYTFANPSRVVDLGSDLTDVDFASEQLSGGFSAAKEHEKPQNKK
jgi:uncharacterized delta-60 repeat protein